MDQNYSLQIHLGQKQKISIKKQSNCAVWISVFTLICTMLFSSRAYADKAINIEYILDASGSMDGSFTTEISDPRLTEQIGEWYFKLDREAQKGRSKITVAKEALRYAIEHRPKGSKVGIRVFGQHVERGCDDTELLLPIGQHEPSELQDAIELIHTSPFGKSPIILALQAATEDFLGFEGEHKIVILTDAEVTCPGNLPQVLADMRARGFSTEIHVIGIDIHSESAMELFKTIANSTGGTFLIAKNENEIKIHLREINPGSLVDVILRRLPVLLPLFSVLLIIPIFLAIVWFYARLAKPKAPKQRYPKWGKKRKISS